MSYILSRIKSLLSLKLIFLVVLTSLIASVEILSGKASMDNVFKKQLNSNNQNGAWEWRSIGSMSSETIKSESEKLKEQNIKVVFLSIGDLVDIKDSFTGQQYIEKSQSIKNSLKQYIKILHSREIRVHALVGGMTWSNDSHQYMNALSLDLVSEYNSEVETDERLDGIQFDVEPHSLKTFDENSQEEMLGLIRVVNQNIDLVKKGNFNVAEFSLGFTLPYWFDGQNGNIAEVTWNNKKAFATYHIFDELAKYSNAYVALMSYRNKAQGEGGTISISEQEIEYLQKNTLPIKLFIGQELNDEKPKSITFFGKTKKEFISEANLVSEKFKNSTNFNGIAVHEVKSFLSMPK